MTVANPWQALTTLHPLRLLRSPWPWRSLAYLFSGAALGAAVCAVLIALGAVSALLTIFIVGLTGFLVLALSGIPVAWIERRRLLLVDQEQIGDPHRPPPAPGWRSWLRTRLREQATWRELAYTVVMAGGLWFIDLIVVGWSLLSPVASLAQAFQGDPARVPWVLTGIALLLVAPFSLTAWAAARAALTRSLLAPSEAELEGRLVEVTRSRARIVDAFEAERQRIERDLHDGVQQRLVALTVALGLARLDLPKGSPLAEQVGQAQEQAKQALAEMRELIRGVHPQVLTGRGLAAAIGDVAGRSPVPVAVDVSLPWRPPPHIEAAAYFAVSEALANVAKHSKANQASVRGRIIDDRLVFEVRDDGVGGANPAAGSGLTGLADRVAVVDGKLMLSSPPAGPTLVRVEIPCLPPDRSG